MRGNEESMCEKMMKFIDFWMNNLAEDRVYILEHFETLEFG